MSSVLNRLTEIEETAASIVNHAEEEKEALNREYDEKTKSFDAALQEQTRKKLEAIQARLERETAGLLNGENGAGDREVRALQKEYDKRHTEYARSILKRITEV